MYNALHAIARRVSSQVYHPVSLHVRTRYSTHMASRSSRIPITRLRFRGHADTLNALCRCLQEHPKQALTAAQLADFTERPFADVHQRLSETPELFTTLPRTSTSNMRYRLTLRIEHKSTEEIAQFIQDQIRSETRIAAAFISAFVGLFVLFSVMSTIY
jgi:hypothetical protein